MAMSTDTEKYHTLGPKDVWKDETSVGTVDIARTTNATGEQLHINCPIYKTDTREELNERLQVCYSVLQDRLEQENRIVSENNKRAQQQRLTNEAIKRNEAKYEKDLRNLQKEAKKQRWTDETLETKTKELRENFLKAQETLTKDLPEGSEVHGSPVTKTEEGFVEATTH